jgi:Na+-translocating ferredoxin:NAD+ oxidoreductase RNF subunit RnfB
MINTEKDPTILRKITSLLPGEHCGKCSFENCGKFAVALAEGKAKPTDCHKGIPNMKEMCEVLGIEAPSEQNLQTMEQRHYHHHGHHRRKNRHNGHHNHSKHKGGHRHLGGHNSKHY